MGRRLRRVLGLAWPHRYRLLLSGSLSGVSVVVALVLPLGIKALLDAALGSGGRMLLDRLALALLGLYVLRAGLNYFGPVVMRATGERIAIDLRLQLYTRLQRLGIRFFAHQSTGALVSRLSNDVGAIRSLMTEITTSLVLQGLKLTGSVAIMLVLNWRLSLVIFLVAPVATLLSRRVTPKVQRMSRDLADRQAKATAVTTEALAGIRLVKAYNRAKHEISRYSAELEQVFGVTMAVTKTTTGLHVVVDLVFMTAIVAIFWFGGTEVVAGRLSAGDFVAFMFYAQNITQGIGEVIRLYTNLGQMIGASDRVFELLDAEPEIADPVHPVPLGRATGRIALENVSFAYDPGKLVLRDITFEVRPGEHIAIVGPSGAGKSTLIGLLPRFFDPSLGSVIIDGHCARHYDVGSLRDQVGIVSQEVFLFSASIADNIRYGRLDASLDEIRAVAVAAQIDEFVGSLPDEYDTLVGENGVRLSGGQRQRISIARALLRDAPILLLDEATSSVDNTAEVAIRDATRTLQKGRTTIVVTHRLTSIRDIPRILVLDEGRLVGHGTHSELMRECSTYEDLVHAGGGEVLQASTV